MPKKLGTTRIRTLTRLRDLRQVVQADQQHTISSGEAARGQIIRTGDVQGMRVLGTGAFAPVGEVLSRAVLLAARWVGICRAGGFLSMKPQGRNQPVRVPGASS